MKYKNAHMSLYTYSFPKFYLLQKDVGLQRNKSKPEI